MTFSRTMMVLLAPILVALNIVFIPFHSGDDEDHFAAAEMAAHFRFGPVRSPDPTLSSGGLVDAAIPHVIDRNFRAVRLHVKPNLERTPWAGHAVFHPLPMSAYLPLVYLPQSAAIRVGQQAGWSVEDTIRAASLVNGFAALGIIALALGYLPKGLADFVPILLALPKSLILFASNSADPMILALTIGLVAFLCRALTSEWRPRTIHYVIAGLAIVALGGVRPPLMALVLLPLYVAVRRRNAAGALISLFAVVAVIAWWAAALPMLSDVRCVSSGTLLQKIANFIENGPALIIETLRVRGVYYWLSFIGEVGYGNGLGGRLHLLPRWVYPAGTGVLLLSILATASEPLDLDRMARALLALGSAAIIGGIFFALGSFCTSAGGAVIGGVQGRYFMTPLLIAVVALAGSAPRLDVLSRAYRLVLPVAILGSFAILLAEGLELYWIRWIGT